MQLEKRITRLRVVTMTLAGVLSTIVAVSACGGDEEAPPSPATSGESAPDASSGTNDSTKGSGNADSTPAPGGTGVCCKPSTTPACCMTYGGYAESADACNRRICDGMPTPSAAWRLEKDEQGCDHWVEPPRNGGACCGCASIPDAGSDADASDAE